MATKKAAVVTKKSAAQKQLITKVNPVKTTAPRAHTVSTVAAKAKRRFVVSQVSAGAVIGEFVGTFIFITAIIASQGNPIVIAFALVALVLAVNTLSNTYFNPALTIAAWLTRRIGGIRAVAYVIAQVLGAMLALVILNWFAQANGATTTVDPATGQASGAVQLLTVAALPSGKEWYVFAAELLGTFIFSFAVASVIKAKERIAVGFTVGFGIFVALVITSSAAGSVQHVASGAAQVMSVINPASAFALKALSFNVWPVAIYVLGPILGAIAGFVLFDLLKNNEETTA